MTKNSQSTYLLRLPRSVKAEVERRAKADGVSINQFVATAVAEKLAAIYGRLLRRTAGACRFWRVRPAAAPQARRSAAAR